MEYILSTFHSKSAYCDGPQPFTGVVSNQRQDVNAQRISHDELEYDDEGDEVDDVSESGDVTDHSNVADHEQDDEDRRQAKQETVSRKTTIELD